MAYIIWKNKNSKSIPGLIITNTPAITKPKMKTNIIKVDGMDGDIVEELGYESYVKTIGIGLANNYDIDEVLKYFTGSGELIISDEPDKIYVCQIIDQINYDRLIRFKKASIKFHVQPFKYLNNENEVVLNINTEKNVKVINRGLEISKPLIKLTGSGIVEIAINNINIFKYTFPEGETDVVIDSIKEEAYWEKNYKNRNMLGIFPRLKVGENIISWTGNLTKIVIEPKSRWL